MNKYSTLAVACGLRDVAGWLENEGWIPKHVRQIRAGAQRLLDLEARARPLSEWTEEDGDVLWWLFPIEEPPYCGSPLDVGRTCEITLQLVGEEHVLRTNIGGWPGYHTHWTRFDVPDEGRALGTEAEGQDAASGLVHEGPADLSATPQPDPVGEAKALLEGLSPMMSPKDHVRSLRLAASSTLSQRKFERLVAKADAIEAALATIRSSQAGEVR